MINIRQRRQQVLAVLSQPGHPTIRSIAAALCISKSSVHRHQQALKQRRQFPEASLWETEAGEEWMKRLVIAAIYVFGIKRGVGAESLSEFFHKLRLEHHVGVSVSSLRKIQTTLEEQILTYQQSEHERLSQACTALPTVCVGVDETWFEQTVLVMMELSSGYLLVEQMADNHHYSTWQKSVQAVLKAWAGRIKYCVNDRAKALIKLAQNDLGCPSIADLFHAMRKLSQGLGTELDQRLGQRQRRLRDMSTQTTPSAANIQALQSEVEGLSAAQREFHQHLMAISRRLHPFEVETNTAQTTPQVSARLHQQMKQLQQFQQAQQLKDAPDSINQFSRQIEPLSAIVDLWWQWVEQSLAARPLTETLTLWLTTVLLPLCYWHYQVQRTDKPALKTDYQGAYQQAHAALLTHPITHSLDAQTYRQWVSWATDMVTKFQRTTAAVEGRNGYLAQRHCCGRGLSARRLQVMTAIHNFDLQRADGSTAAERLFQQPHPNLFQAVLAQVPDLPIPRRHSKPASAKILDLHHVPA
jgi:hypothetical protein